MQHCDIKPDQIIIQYKENVPPSLMLVDFGRALDLKLLSNDRSIAKFTGNICASGMECLSMRNNSTWSYDVDLFGVVMSVFTLLFGEYVDIVPSDRTVMLSRPFKRYWATDLWYLLLDSLASDYDHEDLINNIERVFRSYVEQRRRELEVLHRDQVRLLLRHKVQK